MGPSAIKGNLVHTLLLVTERMRRPGKKALTIMYLDRYP